MDDIDAQKNLLMEWERENPDDPELYTCYFNYYLSLSQEEFITVENEPQNAMSIEIHDTVDNSIGYLNSKIIYNDTDIQKALDYIDKGISKFGRRLDMRFGKIYVYGEIKKWDLFTKEIIATLEYSKTIENSWVWTLNDPIDDGQMYMLSIVQDYISQLFNTEDDALLQNIRDISKAILQIKPNHKESLTNIGVTYIAEEKFDKALDALLKAERVDFKDFIILSNIAFCHKQLGNKQKAIEYYSKTKEYGNDEVKAFADKAIKELQAK